MADPSAKEIDLRIDPKSGSELATCHLMPCSIEHKQLDVKAKEYFWPTIRELKIGGDDEQGRSSKHDKSIGEDNSKDPVLLASFRGRPLQGKRIPVPSGFVGHVVSKEPAQQQHSMGVSANGHKKKVKKHFPEFTYWNWDELPDKNDSVIKALNWLRIAKAIHDPVE